MNAAVVTVAVGGGWPAHAKRLGRTLARFAPKGTHFYSWCGRYPPNCPTHQEVPYGFKYPAIQFAREKGHKLVYWLDSAVIAVKPLQPVFDYMEGTGHLLQPNGFNCGEWSTDMCLEIMGVGREEAFDIPDITACNMGFNFDSVMSNRLLDRMLELVEDGRAFKGPHDNKSGACSKDPRVRGHRHDQVIASLVRHQLDMPMRVTDKPFLSYPVDGVMEKEHVVLVNKWPL